MRELNTKGDAMNTVRLTAKSANRKTGPIPVSTSSRITCPDACPFKAGGCYASGGPLAIVWRDVEKAGMDWAAFCDKVAAMPANTMWRHNQAGDLPGINNDIDGDQLAALVAANSGKKGFTYTHKPPTGANLDAIRAANAGGFTINLSGNTIAHADELSDIGGAPVVCVLPTDTDGRTARTPAGRLVVVCPATYRDTSCDKCGMCAQRDRKFIVGFPAHGSAAKKANAIATK